MTVWKLGLWGATSTAARLNVDSLAWVAADAPGRSISTLCSVPEDRGSCTKLVLPSSAGRVHEYPDTLSVQSRVSCITQKNITFSSSAVLERFVEIPRHGRCACVFPGTTGQIAQI